MTRFILGVITGPVVGGIAWHFTHSTLVSWIAGVTVALLLWFGAPIIGAVADVADDLID